MLLVYVLDLPKKAWLTANVFQECVVFNVILGALK